MKKDRVVVIGAGVGGLAAAIDLSRRGVEVTVVERAATPGGKLRQVDGIDAGPTVFTMRWAFDGLFADAGETLADHLTLEPIDVLARHAWAGGARLDLFPDIEQTADAIGAFASARDAQGYRDFCARAKEIYQTLAPSFIGAERPSPLELVTRVGLGKLDLLWRTMPFSSLWDALEGYFVDPRLRQLFGRYATYVGSSPLQIPATLMLVAHVEREGLWRVHGGMYEIARALHRLAEARGARFMFGAEVKEVLVSGGRASGVLLADGEQLSADAVVFNGDVSALGSGLLGAPAMAAAPATPVKARSLSAVTWCMHAQATGFPLLHHNVFFGHDYADEFDAIFRRRGITAAPTVYLAAQDRDGSSAPKTEGVERMLVLINAPADGDSHVYDAETLQALSERALELLSQCGLQLSPARTVGFGPSAFEELFPSSGGALYGRANHGFLGTFERLGAVTGLPGLYAAGGSVHPGPGVPMAVLSARLCAARVCEDHFGRAPSTRGGLSVATG
ncbi:MAG: phytoene desaturase family protein [Myxococcales bacterium]|nr:phytoene desaturase family protein [Myxococcales bacterium]